MRRMYSKSQIEKLIDEHGGGGGAVSSVNGKTGSVILNATDIKLTTNQQTIQDNFLRIDTNLGRKLDIKYYPSTNYQAYTKTPNGEQFMLDATSNVVNSSIAVRTPNGQIRCANPVGETDCVNKRIMDTALNGKQDKLTAGANINIVDNVISATGSLTTVSWGGIIGALSNQTDLVDALNDKQDILTAGAGITINNNIISSNLYIIDATNEYDQSMIRSAVNSGKKVVLIHTNQYTNETVQADLVECPNTGNILFATPLNANNEVTKYTIDSNDSWTVSTISMATDKYMHNIVFKPVANSGYGGVISFSIITTDPTPLTKYTLDDVLESYLANGKRIPCSGRYRATASDDFKELYAISYSSNSIQGWIYKYDAIGEGNPIQIGTDDLFDYVVTI